MQRRILEIVLGGAVLAGLAAAQAQELPQLGKSPTRDVVAALTREEKVNLVTGTGMRMPGQPPGQAQGQP
jgi:hypothetical protein